MANPVTSATGEYVVTQGGIQFDTAIYAHTALLFPATHKYSALSVLANDAPDVGYEW